MARYCGSVCRLCRREGEKLFLKGERCLSTKCALERRNYPPGVHGQQRVKMKEYGMQLREKQKVKRMYGVLEKPFRTYFRKAGRKQGVTGENLLMFLETRFDSVVLKLGLASSRWQSRQLIRHNHFEVNGSRVNIPSFQVSQGDIIRVRENSRNKDVITESVEMRSDGQIPDWLDLDRKNLQGTVVNMPTRDSISTPINEQLIIELYSK